MMQSTTSWSINRTEDFDEIEITEVILRKKNKHRYFVVEDGQSLEYRKVATWKFFLRRYPILAIPVLIISLSFLILYPLMFFIYIGIATMLFTITVRRCRVDFIGNYIMVFWLIHLLINFFLLGGGLVDISSTQHTVQGLLIGMLLVHLWIFTVIFFYRYHNIFNLIDYVGDAEAEGEGAEISTKWYLWRGCSMCNKRYIPFVKNCKDSV